MVIHIINGYAIISDLLYNRLNRQTHNYYLIARFGQQHDQNLSHSDKYKILSYQ